MDRKVIRALWAGVLVFLGLIVSALGLAGITNMSAARLLLVAAWAAAVITVVTVESFAAQPTKKVLAWTATVVLVSGGILFVIDRWMIFQKSEKEIDAQSKTESLMPATQIDLAEQIATSRKSSTETKKEPLSRTIQTPKGPITVCNNPPIGAVLNWWPVTFKEPAELCHDLPLIDGRKADGQFSHSQEDLMDGLTAEYGETVSLLIWINNGAANNHLDPSKDGTGDAYPAIALAKNVSVTTSTDTRPGTMHYISVTVFGDNCERIYGQFKINTNPNERLELIPKSGQVLNYTGDKILAERFDIGNSTLKIGDLRPNWDDGLFIYFGVKIVR
jgi:hypothetical protein